MTEELTNPASKTCEYCGTILDARLYFCSACAKPHRPVEQLIGSPAPAYEDTEMKLRIGGRSAWNVFFIYLIVMFITGFIAMAIWGEDQMEPVILLSDLAIAITTVVMTIRFWNELKPLLFNFTSLIHPWFWAGLAILAPLLLINFGYHEMLTQALDLEPEDYNDYFSSSWGPVLFICVMPAITEEIAFRGIIQHQFEKVVKPHIAVLVASAIFSAAHFSVLSAPYLAMVGLLLGWMKLKTNSLYPPMIAHFLHNFVVINWI